MERNNQAEISIVCWYTKMRVSKRQLVCPTSYSKEYSAFRGSCGDPYLGNSKVELIIVTTIILITTTIIIIAISIIIIITIILIIITITIISITITIIIIIIFIMIITITIIIFAIIIISSIGEARSDLPVSAHFWSCPGRVSRCSSE